MSNWLAVPFALMFGITVYACGRWRYWRFRCLFLESCTRAVAEAMMAEAKEQEALERRTP